MPNSIAPPKRLLMGPGPSPVAPTVLSSMSQPLLGHLDPEFLNIMNETGDMLRTVMQTRNELTFAVSATGSAGMEACLVNLLEPGDEAVVCIHGVFGTRMHEIVKRCGATPITVEAEWGSPIDPGKLKNAVQGRAPRIVAIVHAETSTGVLQPMEEISRIAHEAGALLVVDAVTSLGGTAVCVDEWGIDALYSGTQKCLSAPPGLSPVTFSPRAVDLIMNRRSPVQSWYLDVTLIRNYWGSERAYHHTAPISSIYALHEALRLALEEGLEARFKRHRSVHEQLRTGLEALGYEYVVAPEFRLPMLNSVRIPAGIDDKAARARLLNEFGIEIGGGLGAFAGKVWRIGLMGHGCSAENVERLLGALRQIVNR
jgi:alanine-glyoxylate transaminase/serine-glyoxylate transaminase/serine-pyruvate transaminase